MRFLLLDYGTVEVFWSLHGALIDLGHESAISLLSGLPAVLDGPIDVIVTMNLFSRPRDVIEGVVNTVSSFGRVPLVINFCLSHPLAELGCATPGSAQEMNGWMGRHGISAWTMCRSAALECRNLGLTQVLYFPLGVHPHTYAVPSRDGCALEIYGRWMSLRTPGLLQVPYADVGMVQDTEVEDAVSGRFLYLGQCVLKDYESADGDVIRDAERVSALVLSEPGVLRYDAIMRCGLAAEMRSPQWLLEFNKAYAQRHSMVVRRRFVTALSRALGDDLAVWGDHWDRFGVTAHPNAIAPRCFYHKAAACLDFGSMTLDTAVFPRTMEIVKQGGLLMSWRHSDTDLLFGPFEKLLTFNDEDDAVAKLKKVKEDPEFFQRVRQGHFAYVNARLAFTGIIGTMLGAPAPERAG